MKFDIDEMYPVPVPEGAKYKGQTTYSRFDEEDVPEELAREYAKKYDEFIEIWLKVKKYFKD